MSMPIRALVTLALVCGLTEALERTTHLRETLIAMIASLFGMIVVPLVIESIVKK